jgi:hypothetical protein
MLKVYGKLNKNQLKGFLELILNLKQQREEVLSFSKKDWNTAYQRLGEDLTWSWCYELPMMEHLSFLALSMGLEKQLHKHAQNLDYDNIIDKWPYSDINIEDGNFSKYFTNANRAALFFALQRSFESLETYSRSLNALVADVRDGIDSSLFDVVRLDHSAISNPTIARRITRAELENDENFFGKLVNALRGRPEKHPAYYTQLRLSLALLEEMGELDKLSEQEAYQLFYEDLQIYSTTSKDPARSLLRFIQRWKKKVRATSNRDFVSSEKE